jgi:hydrogenase maturation protease
LWCVGFFDVQFIGILETGSRSIHDIRGDHVKALVVGIGNAFRGDDAAGLAVARVMRQEQPAGVVILELDNNITALIDSLAGYDIVMIIDATHSGSPPGTIHRIDTSETPLLETGITRSTHGMTVGSMLELARAQQLLPKKVLVYGIEGKQFDHGAPLTPEVEKAVRIVAQMVYADIGAEAWS